MHSYTANILKKEDWPTEPYAGLPKVGEMLFSTSEEMNALGCALFYGVIKGNYWGDYETNVYVTRARFRVIIRRIKRQRFKSGLGDHKELNELHNKYCL